VVESRSIRDVGHLTVTRPELGQISAHFDPAVSHPVGHSSAQHGESSCPFARDASPTAPNLVYRALLAQRTHGMELALEQLGDSESVPGREFGPPNRDKAGPASAQISVALNTNPLASGLRHFRTPIRDPSQVSVRDPDGAGGRKPQYSGRRPSDRNAAE
jgi:hypothetical protein